jgi:hypothetical protein
MRLSHLRLPVSAAPVGRNVVGDVRELPESRCRMATTKKAESETGSTGSPYPAAPLAAPWRVADGEGREHEILRETCGLAWHDGCGMGDMHNDNSSPAGDRPRLLDRVRETIRARGYSPRTAEA